MGSSTGIKLFGNLRSLYQSYGGMRAILRSPYVWASIILTVLCGSYAIAGSWAERTLSIMPTLAGFSIAAFAIYFSVLDAKAQDALKAPDASLGGRSPLLALASTVIHTVIVQVASILFAFVFLASPLRLLFSLMPSCIVWNLSFMHADFPAVASSFFGLFLTIYGIVLLFACSLAIFKLIQIKVSI